MKEQTGEGAAVAAPSSEGRRAYRYRVTDRGGAGVKAVGDSPFVLDWKYLGKTYDWNIFDFGGGKAKPVGFISGEFVDKGTSAAGSTSVTPTLRR